MSFRSTVVAAALLASAANAHMTMQTPVIYSQDKALIDTAPLTPEQFPCHSQYGFEVTKMNPMAVGSPLKAVLKGSAIHGGGSCQLSITTDTAPTKDSKFKVIKSFEGNCPSGGDAELEYTLPASIPNGKATFAWTWFSVLSGGPELYMNCAPIEVSGGASDTTAFDALPDMLVANLGSATTCKSVTGSPIKFPNPGAELVSGGDKEAVLPTGECGATGASPAPAPAPSAAPAPIPSAAPAPIPSAAPAPIPSAAPAPIPSAAPAPAPPSATSPSSPSDPTETETCDEDEPAASPPSATEPAAPGPVATSPPIIAPPTASTAPTVPTVPTVPAPGGSTCTTDGAVMCNGTTQFGICNYGTISWQPVAAGTTCVNGAIQKRSSFKSAYNGRIVRPRTPVAYKI